MALIELNNVFKSYFPGELEVEVLRDINLAVEAGEMIAIMGPSGSGKSTLMNLLGLLDRPTQGELRIGGEQVTLSMPDNKLAQLRGRRIGFVFQSFNLLPRSSALENVLMPTIYRKQGRKDREQRATALLEQVGLEKRIGHSPAELSGGEKQRVAIARALINDPEVILADEPTGNLDTKSGEAILDILEGLNKQGKTVVMITHDPKIADRCQRQVRLVDGRIVKSP